MELSVQNIAVGDWVEIVNHELLKGFKGFVLKISENKFRVKITRNPKGKSCEGKVWMAIDQVTPSRTLCDEDDLLILIDLALDTHDEAWFKELTDMLPLINF